MYRHHTLSNKTKNKNWDCVSSTQHHLTGTYESNPRYVHPILCMSWLSYIIYRNILYSHGYEFSLTYHGYKLLFVNAILFDVNHILFDLFLFDEQVRLMLSLLKYLRAHASCKILIRSYGTIVEYNHLFYSCVYQKKGRRILKWSSASNLQKSFFRSRRNHAFIVFERISLI